MADRSSSPPAVGYCRSCLTNVRHRRVVRTAWGRWLDRLTWGVGQRLGIGTWLCVSCGGPRWLFPAYRPEAGEYDPQSSSTRHQPPAAIERVGNVLERQQSLVTRAIRRQQYTPAFRAQIVEALLRGETTFAAARQRLELSELDLQDWIAEYHRAQLALARGEQGSDSILEGQVIRGASAGNARQRD